MRGGVVYDLGPWPIFCTIDTCCDIHCSILFVIHCCFIDETKIRFWYKPSRDKNVSNELVEDN